MFQALPEDWYSEDQFFYELARTIPEGKYVTLFTSVIYHITMAVEFLGRLGNQDFFKNEVRVKMTLHNVANRKLYTDSNHRYPLIHPRITHAQELFVEEELSMEEIIKNPIGISNKFIIEILDGFGYNPLASSVMVDQDKCMSGG